MLTLLIAVHVVVSLAAIGFGLLVVSGFLSSRPHPAGNLVFLVASVLTSLSGFLLPASRFLPSHAVGLVSLVTLAIAFLARYLFHLQGNWQRAYVISALLALYLNLFVFVIQLFRKLSPLGWLPPAESGPAFPLIQFFLLGTFAAIAFAGTKRSRRQPLAN